MNAHNTEDQRSGHSAAEPRSVRAPWQQPVLRAMDSASAETGVNSTTDASATFS
ncbi:MAG TPA: hypothetical protein VG387_09235 [Rhizomicrobium sp.]|jgi:hypothetical protein|nr:hypothetical protein [Rhizomicrobium sp.]